MVLISSPAIVILVVWCLGFAVSILSKRRPNVICFWIFLGVLFLPQFRLDIPILWPNKAKVIGLCAGLAALAMQSALPVSDRFRMIDLPAFILPLAAFLASISNGLGAYDGLTAAAEMFQYWSCPWFVGRFVFGRSDAALLLIRMLIIAAIVYVPLCLLEMRLSPVLHSMVYGYAPRGGGSLRAESFRFGLWRPTVFMEFGLQLSLFMGAASVAAFWGWLTGNVKPILNVSLLVWASVLGATTLMCVSTGAILLAIVGWSIVTAVHYRFPIRILILSGLTAIPVVYPLFRIATPEGINLSEFKSTDRDVSARITSLQVRITNERLFLQRWSGRPFLGWTAQKYFVPGVKVIPDSMWIQTLCKFGLLGWGSYVLLQVSPMWIRLMRRRVVGNDEDVSMVCSMISLMFAFDCLANAMEMPIYGLLAGAAVSVSRIHSSGCVSASLEDAVAGRSLVIKQPWPRPLVSSEVENR